MAARRPADVVDMTPTRLRQSASHPEARQKETYWLNELALRGQFLNQGGDVGQEHPKNGGPQRVHH